MCEGHPISAPAPVESKDACNPTLNETACEPKIVAKVEMMAPHEVVNGNDEYQNATNGTTTVLSESDTSVITESSGTPPNGESNEEPENGSSIVKLQELSIKINGMHNDSSTKFKVVQIGCGVVGHAYAQAFKQAGHDVVGVEASRTRMDELKDCYPMRHISEDMTNELGVDFILLSINTPLDPSTGALNMRYLWSSLGNVSALLTSSPDALVVVRSTVTLGFSAAYRSALEDNLDRTVKVCFQPEFLRAKSALEDALAPWQVVIGCERAADAKSYVLFQRGFVDPRRISLCSVDEAEVMKIFHNSYNAAKISFWNQAGLLVEKISSVHGKRIDPKRTFHLIGKTCEGLLSPAYGLTPGHAYYGTCLPKDSAELAHMEKTYGLESSLFEEVVKVNNVMREKDTEEVLYGDNHADNNLFHQRSAPNDKPLVIDNKESSNDDVINASGSKSKNSLVNASKLNDISAHSPQGVKVIA